MLSERTWCVSKRGYATATVNSRKRGLHQFLMGKEGMDVDHIDGDKLNNVRSNLRVCEHHKNMRNLKPRHWLTLKGVSKNGTGWTARLRWKGEGSHHLGTFSTEEAAARAYDRKAYELDPEFARLNYDDGIWSEEKIQSFRVFHPISGSGHEGIYKNHGRWQAAVRVNKKQVYIGNYPTIEEAIAARSAYIQTMKIPNTP